MTVAVLANIRTGPRGLLNEISEGTHGHACRLSGGGLVSGRSRHLRDDAEDGEAIGRGGQSGPRPGSIPAGPPQLRRGRRPGGRDAWPAPRAGSRPSGCCRWRRRRAMGARPATSGGWWPRRRPTWRSKNHRGRRPGVWAPGDVVVFDWGEIGPLFVFCAVVAWSRCALRVLHRQPRAPRPPWRPWPSASSASAGCPKTALTDRMGCLKGGDGRRAGDPDAGLRALRHPLRVPARLLRGGRPRVQGPGREPGRLREVRPHDPRSSCRSPTWPPPTPRRRLWCDEVNAAVHSEICCRSRRAPGDRAGAVRRPAVAAGRRSARG